MQISQPTSPGKQPDHSLGIDEMDRTHGEFLAACGKLKSTSGEDFSAQLEKLVAHTRLHFENENRLMAESGFPPTPIHMGEHERVLLELENALQLIQQEPSKYDGATFSNELLQWFETHLRSMDTALAVHLRTVRHPAAMEQ